GSGVDKRLIGSAAALETVLSEEFGITDVDVAVIWPRIAARHAALFGPDAAESIPPLASPPAKS
ncbi:MAG: hypothetical protein B7Y02_17460, partial [Rhodobacterales bacterium 17-64-5]